MPIELQTAIIAAMVALFTAGISSYSTWRQVQRERVKWLTDLKAAYAVELYKARLVAYSKMQEIIGQLSWQEKIILTPERAHEVATAINAWVYSTGGLIVETPTRRAILGLRNVCMRWTEGPQPKELLEFRNVSLLLMRRDLDIIGLGSYEDLGDQSSLLDQLRQDIQRLEQRRK
jgi:hypothetical protein